MKSVWNIPGLPDELRRAYRTLSQNRRLITIEDEKLVVYSGNLNGLAASVAELIQRGLVEKRRIGKRTLILLGNWEAVEKRFTNVEGRVSTIFTDDMKEYLERYDEDQSRVVEQAFSAFGSIRRGGVVSPGILFRQLQTYMRYPVEAVIEGLRIYLEGGHAETGKGERYAVGIIRGCAKATELTARDKSTQEVHEVTTQEDETVNQRRERQQQERAALDSKVQELANEKYEEDCDLSKLTPSAVSELVCEAKRQLR